MIAACALLSQVWLWQVPQLFQRSQIAGVLGEPWECPSWRTLLPAHQPLVKGAPSLAINSSFVWFLCPSRPFCVLFGLETHEWFHLVVPRCESILPCYQSKALAEFLRCSKSATTHNRWWQFSFVQATHSTKFESTLSLWSLCSSCAWSFAAFDLTCKRRWTTLVMICWCGRLLWTSCLNFSFC